MEYIKSFVKLILVFISIWAIDHSFASIFGYEEILDKSDLNGRDALILIGYLSILIFLMFGFFNGWDKRSIINFIKHKEPLKSETKKSIIFLVIYLMMLVNLFID
jgi:hypothetical protein